VWPSGGLQESRIEEQGNRQLSLSRKGDREKVCSSTTYFQIPFVWGGERGGGGKGGGGGGGGWVGGVGGGGGGGGGCSGVN